MAEKCSTMHILAERLDNNIYGNMFLNNFINSQYARAPDLEITKKNRWLCRNQNGRYTYRQFASSPNYNSLN